MNTTLAVFTAVSLSPTAKPVIDELASSRADSLLMMMLGLALVLVSMLVQGLSQLAQPLGEDEEQTHDRPLQASFANADPVAGKRE
jgi:hypothetical protein